VGGGGGFDGRRVHAYCLRGAASFAPNHPDPLLVCVGGGPPAYAEELKALANSLGLAHRVVWAGEVNDVKAAYNSFNIATLSSSFGEGFPNAVGEAMACGTPVVATDIGDARWIIGEFGEVVPPGNPDLLCAGWTRLRMRLARDSGLREATPGATVANYGVDAMLGRTEAILPQLVAGRAAADLSRDLA